LCGVVGIDWFVDMLVGPHVPSSGPGPYLEVPGRASLLVDRRWEMLPLFRSGARTIDYLDIAGRLSGHWFALAGEDLARTAGDVSSAPLRLRHEITDEPIPALWTSSIDAASAEPFRLRFIELLSHAHAAGDAVLLRRAHPDVHDVPRDAAWGNVVFGVTLP
jgi:hypothetical protein